MSSEFNEKNYSSKMDKSINSFKKDISTLRTGRANASMLDLIKVDVYGQQMPINQVGSITTPEPRMINIQVWDSNNVSLVDAAIQKSELGLNPQIDGQLIRLPIPDLSEERRNEIKKIVKSPLGKAAILGIAGFGLPTAAGQSLFGGFLSPGIKTGIGKFFTENALGKILRDVGIGTAVGGGLEYLENRNLPDPIKYTSGRTDEDIEEIVAVGTKASLKSALDKQKDSNQVVSIVDSDALGDFPDNTAAEAIRRLSGITVENDQGEGRYVSIRGLSGDLNSISVNGALVPAPEGGRKVMLDGLPTELLDSIEVYKTLTADQDADSIGGRIEFNTKRATSLKKTLFKAKFDTSYNDQSKNSDNPKIALTYGDMISDSVGHIIGLTYASKQIITYNNETGFPGWTNDGAGKRLDDDWEMRYYDLTRERTGLTYDIDYKIDDQTAIIANFLYNNYEDNELRYKDEYGSLKHGEVFSNYSEINRIRRDAEVRRRIETRDIRTALIGAETMINGWFTEIQFSHYY